MKPTYLILLSLVAGFCDTATFIHMDGVFSSHVTGNFVMFAVAMAQGLSPGDYLKLATFPVFVLAVIVSVIWYGKSEQLTIRHLLLPAAICLTLAAGMSSFVPVATDIRDTFVTLLVVLALGSQNALHHALKGPMTTVMTGIVTRTTAMVTGKLKQPAVDGDSQLSLSLAMIAAFTLGCVVGAFATRQWGLCSIWLPALIVLLLARYNAPLEKINDE